MKYITSVIILTTENNFKYDSAYETTDMRTTAADHTIQ